MAGFCERWRRDRMINFTQTDKRHHHACDYARPPDRKVITTTDKKIIMKVDGSLLHTPLNFLSILPMNVSACLFCFGILNNRLLVTDLLWCSVLRTK
jgi:hypothetical protein